MAEVCFRKFNMFDFDAFEDGVRPIPDSDFEVILLGDNPARSVKIRYGFPFNVKYIVIECLQENAYLFAISPYEIVNIDPSMGYH